MTSLRKLLLLVTTLALAVFALPASADNKVYNLTISPSSVTAGSAGVAMTATFANVSPDGNSTFKSVKLFTLPAGLTIKTATVGPGYSANVTNNGTSVYADSINPPVKPFSSKPFTLLLTVDVACSAATGSWTTIQNSLQQVWTGTGWTGSNFALNNPPFPMTTVNGTGGCSYTLSGIPASVAAGSTNNLTIGLANNAASGGPSITKFVVTVPAGLSIPNTYTPPSGVSVSGNQVTVNTTVAAASSTSFALTVNAPPSCSNTAAASWSPTPTPSSFTGNSPTTAITGQTCSATVTAPTSALSGTAFVVKVDLIGGGPGGGDVTVTSPNCTYTGGGTVTAAAGVYSVSFPNFTLTTLGACTISATVTGGYAATAVTTSTYIGTLDCNLATNPVFPPVPGSPGYFANLPTGVTSVTQSGFAAGYRVTNDKSDPCQLVNYTFTNNILGTGPTTDAAGNTIPTNAAAVVWDLAFQPNAVFVYMLTFLPEYVDTVTGLPIKKTKFCILGTSPTDCTVLANQKNLQACMNPAFSSTSIPGSDPACIMQETWTTLAPSACAGLTNPNAGNADPTPPACVKGTDEILDARDPPIIRG